MKNTKVPMKITELTWLSISLLSGLAGIYLIVIGTGATTINRYLVPPEILPGIGILYVCAILISILAARENNVSQHLAALRKLASEKIGASGCEKMRNMFLLLSVLLVGFALTPGTTPMYHPLAMNYFASLILNLVTSIVAAVGLFGWLCAAIVLKK